MSDRGLVEQTADALRARGYRVELATGLDTAADGLLPAVTALSGQGLYVLCRSDALDRAAIDGLRSTLREHDVPFGRTLTLATASQTARELEERIVSVLRRMVTGRPAPEEAQPPTEPEPEPEAAALSLPSAPVMPPAYTGAEHTEVAGVTNAEPPSTPALSPPRENTGPTMRPHASASASLSASASASASAVLDPPLTFGGRLGRALGTPTGLTAVAGGVLLIGAIAIGIAVSGDDEDEGADTVAAAEPSKSKKKQSDEPKADAPPTADDEAAGDAGPADAEPTAADSAEPDEPPAGDAAVVAASPAPAQRRVGDPPPPLPSRDFSAANDPPEVQQALRDREVRALDVFLVAPERPGTLSFERAERYCDELEVASLSGWRVPSIGEINAVGMADMLGRSIFWSATAGDTFGDFRLVLNTKKKRVSIVESTWDGAKIVCVRLRQP